MLGDDGDTVVGLLTKEGYFIAFVDKGLSRKLVIGELGLLQDQDVNCFFRSVTLKPL